MAPGSVAVLRDVVFRHAGSDGFILRVPHLELQAGESVACVGPSGSGKTTLVNLLSGTCVASEGSVYVLGSALETIGESARRQLRLLRIGMLFQELELVEYLSTLENMLLPIRLAGRVPTFEDREHAAGLARTMRIEHLLSRRPRQLSQGERQRAALCRAIIHSPTLMLCDEPTGNLDPDNSRRVLDLLLDYAAESGCTLLLVTHNHALLDRFDRVLDMTNPTLLGPSREGVGS